MFTSCRSASCALQQAGYHDSCYYGCFNDIYDEPRWLLRRSALAEGNVTPEMGDVLTMTDKLKAGLGEMLDEHKAIVRALKKLADAAKKEGKRGYERFAEKLVLHAQTEERVL